MDDLVTANTINAPEHLQTLVTLLDGLSHISGDIAEVGVYKGGSARLLCLHAHGARVWVIDTFDGMPQESEHDNHHHKGDFSDTCVERVARSLVGLKNYNILQGQFPQANGDVLEGVRFKLVHIDVDIYASVHDCLAFFARRMVAGGVIVLDDYTTPTCLGAKRATDEFMQAHPQLKLVTGPRCQAHILA